MAAVLANTRVVRFHAEASGLVRRGTSASRSALVQCHLRRSSRDQYRSARTGAYGWPNLLRCAVAGKPRVSSETDSVRTPAAGTSSGSTTSGGALVPDVQHVLARGHVRHGEPAVGADARERPGRHGDDEAHHARVDVAVDGVHADARERRRPRVAPRRYSPRSNAPKRRVREHVVAEGILVGEVHAPPARTIWTCGMNSRSRMTMDAADGSPPGRSKRTGRVHRLEIDDGVRHVVPRRGLWLGERHLAGHGALRARRMRRHDAERQEARCAQRDAHGR